MTHFWSHSFRVTKRHTTTMAATTKRELLHLYKRLLRYAEVYPSIKRESIYSAIRDDFREHRNSEDPQPKIALAYQGLAQLRQFSEDSMTKGNIGSPNWNVTLEQNPMPKPDDYDERKKQKDLPK